jgi:hypothetical protein
MALDLSDEESNATVRGRFSLRACFVNHRSTEADVRAVVSEVLTA